MEGSHTNPTIQATWQVPVAQASGQVKLDKDSMHLSAKYDSFYCNSAVGDSVLLLGQQQGCPIFASDANVTAAKCNIDACRCGCCCYLGLLTWLVRPCQQHC